MMTITEIKTESRSDVVSTVRRIIYENLHALDSKVRIDDINHELTLDEIGLDSLTMQQVVFEIEQEYNLQLNMEKKYAKDTVHHLKPTIKEFSIYVESQLEKKGVAV